MSELSSSRPCAAQPGVSVKTMTWMSLLSFSLLLLAFLCTPASLLAQTPTPVTVANWRYDLTGAGQNTSETALTPANVNVNSFGKLFSLPVDGLVYAQPLYVPGLTMGDGLVHNVLFVATEHDSVYAFDADSNGGANAKPLWHASFLDTDRGASEDAATVPWQDTGSPDVAPEIGITATPVIDPASQTLFVVAATKENGLYVSRLHALNILNGAERANSPVEVKATVTGTGNGSSGGQLAFSPLWQNQRTPLSLYKGHVYFAYGAHGDNGPWHGWIFSYDATTLTQSAAVCLSSNGSGAGVWGSGASMPIDDGGTAGRMFVVTGNGTHTAYPPLSANSQLGESVVAFDLSNGGIKASDAFTSFNWQRLNSGDLDQGSGGILMAPDQQGASPHILVQAGKEGRIVVLNRDHLGGFAAGAASNTNALQDIPNQIKGLWSTPAYWNGNVYIWGNGDVPKLFKLNSGVMDTTPASQSPVTSEFPGASFSVSSNGAQNGIAWAVRTDKFNSRGPAVLYAWDANDLSTPLYESDAKPARDAAGAAVKFAIPVVTNGKVYVSARGVVNVYGLLNAEPSAAPPVITPDGGTFAGSQSVTLSSTTASAGIFYTLDGSVPTPGSTPYTGPITISTGTTLSAIASAPGFIQSPTSSATFTFSGQTPAVAFSPAGGTYAAAQSVTLSDTDASAAIYYTTDGSAPTATSNRYVGPIAVGTSQTINAIAIDPNLQNSNVATAAYVIQLAGSSIDFSSGFSSTAGLTLNGSTVATNDTRLQLTNGLPNEAGTLFWTAPIGIQSFTTDFEFQLSLAQGDGFTFAIQNVGATALGGNSGGLGYAGIGKSVAIKFDFFNNAGEGDDSTGVYVNGALPTVPSVDMTPSGVELNSGDSMLAHVTYDGTTLIMKLTDLVTNKTFTLTRAINIPQIVGGNMAYVGFTGGTGGLSSSQKILTWVYSSQTVATTAAPTFSPAAGSYNAAQSVTLSSATTDAAIYYTTDGSTPTPSSSLYSGPIQVASSETITALAISPTLGNSTVVSAAYVIQLPAPGGSFSLSASPAAAVTQGASTASTITVTPTSGFTGNVALTCAITSSPARATGMPTCSATAPAAIAGAAPVTATLTINTTAASTPGTYTVAVTGTSGSITESTSVTFAVTPASPTTTPSFTLSSTAVAIASPGVSGTSTITVTPSGGFTGNVALTCAVAGPPGATDMPTCSAAAPASISGAGPVTATLTINTTAASTAAAHNPMERIFTLGSGGTLAALLFALPIRRRKWRTLFSLLVFSVIAGAAMGCGNGTANQPPPVSTNGGTTAGNYTVTVTGVSGQISATTAVIVTVN